MFCKTDLNFWDSLGRGKNARPLIAEKIWYIITTIFVTKVTMVAHASFIRFANMLVYKVELQWLKHHSDHQN